VTCVTMFRRKISQVVVLAVGILIGSVTEACCGGDTGVLFLRIGVGAPAAAMADAYTAAAQGQSACYWNPAGLVGVHGKNVLFMHTQWLQGIRHEYGGMAVGDGKTALGLSFAYNTAGQLELRSRPAPRPEATFSIHDVMLALSCARSTRHGLSLGITGKFLYEKIYIESTSGFAFDLGLLYRLSSTHLNLGLSLRNMGKMTKLKEDPVRLPFLMQLGVSYQFHVTPGDVLVCFDLELPRDSVNSLQFGIEYQLCRFLWLRAGYQTGHQERNIAAGLGLRVGRWQIDYAYVPYYFDLGDTHRISLEFCQGR